MATNRLEYRDSKTPRAVKVYTVAQESRYLLFENVPALNVVDNLLVACQLIGTVVDHQVLNESCDQFCDVVLVVFHNAKAARKAKRTMDDRPFFANLLRVSYAPQYETVDDVRNKLLARRSPIKPKIKADPNVKEAKKRRRI